MNEWDDAIFRWTVRGSLALYAAALLLRSRPLVARTLWSAAFALMLIHVAAAFHFVHGWSHDAAVVATARRTHDVVGLDWGGGVFVNYVLLLIWGFDVAWWWMSRDSYERRSWWIEGSVQGFLAFIAFNSTVVFGQGAIRWIGCVTFIVLATVFATRRPV